MNVNWCPTYTTHKPHTSTVTLTNHLGEVSIFVLECSGVQITSRADAMKASKKEEPGKF